MYHVIANLNVTRYC